MVKHNLARASFGLLAAEAGEPTRLPLLKAKFRVRVRVRFQRPARLSGYAGAVGSLSLAVPNHV